MPNDSANSNGPPPPNPVLTAYESYIRDTPLVTRYTLNAILFSFFSSFFVNPAYALANIPLFTIFKFQLYRIVTSPFICSDILSLLFVFMGFMNHGIRLEQSMGSALFGALFFSLTIVSNVLFVVISVILWGLTNSEDYLVAASLGIWTTLLGVIAVECSQAPGNSKRRLFFLEVPTLYYPLAILALFSLFAGVKLSYCLGVAVGYAYGFGKMDRLKVKVDTARKWEGGFMRGFVSRAGWVSVDYASGPSAWTEGAGGEGGGQSNSGGGGSSIGGPGAVNSPSDPSETVTPSFTGAGRSLGSSSGSRRGLLSRGNKSNPPKTAEERAALLERAAERRRQQSEDGGDSAV